VLRALINHRVKKGIVKRKEEKRVIMNEGGSFMKTTEIPTTIYYYSEVFDASKENYHYKLNAIGSGQRIISYCAQNIQKSNLDGVDLAQIQLFNSVYIPEYNAASLCFVFSSLEHGSFYCNLTCSGTLQIIHHHPPSALAAPLLFVPSQTMAMPPAEGDVDTYLACSVYTSIHDYIQTRSGHFFHLGVSFVPCSTLFIPLWLQNSYLEQLLCKWSTNKLTLANTESLIAVRMLDGNSSVRHAIRRPSEKHMRVVSNTSPNS